MHLRIQLEMQTQLIYITCSIYKIFYIFFEIKKKKLKLTKRKKNRSRSGTAPETKIFGAAHTHSVVHFALNFVIVLFLKATERSQRIFSLSNKLKISKLERGFQPRKVDVIFCNNNKMIKGLKKI